MKLLNIVFLIVFVSTMSLACEMHHYKKIFSKKNWETKKAFTKWAKFHQLEKVNSDCSDDLTQKISIIKSDILYCKVLGYVKKDRKEFGNILFTIVKGKSLSKDHDCNSGLVFIGQTGSVTFEDGPADCKYALEVENPGSVPESVFEVKKDGRIGIVYNWHGQECGGESVMIFNPELKMFKRVYTFNEQCTH